VGWTQVYADDFSGTDLGAGWFKYSGAIPSMPGGTWSPSQVQVTQGTLRLLTAKVDGQWTSGGVMNDVQAQTTYGKYLVRFRMDKANGVKYALLLWPASKQWPMDGEIDFAEDGGGDRSAATATVIWGQDGASREQIQRRVTSDFSSWHTVGVEWTPGQLVYTLDGAPWATVQTENVPSKPMDLALQTEAGSCNEWMTCTDSTTPATTVLEVDWVAVYRRT
jgi:beta-glucanase (GH16 family)